MTVYVVTLEYIGTDTRMAHGCYPRYEEAIFAAGQLTADLWKQSPHLKHGHPAAGRWTLTRDDGRGYDIRVLTSDMKGEWHRADRPGRVANNRPPDARGEGEEGDGQTRHPGRTEPGAG